MLGRDEHSLPLGDALARETANEAFAVREVRIALAFVPAALVAARDLTRAAAPPMKIARVRAVQTKSDVQTPRRLRDRAKTTGCLILWVIL